MQMSALLSTHITLQLSPVAQAPGQPSNLGELLKQANEMVRNGEKKNEVSFQEKNSCSSPTLSHAASSEKHKLSEMVCFCLVTHMHSYQPSPLMVNHLSALFYCP